MQRTTAWSQVQRRLHWAVAAVVLVQYLSQDAMHDAMALVAAQQTPGVGTFLVTTLHVWGGAAAGATVLWRLRLRQFSRTSRARGVRARIALVNHLLLYLLLLMMAVSGALHYGLDFEPAARWHNVGKWLLAGCLFLHVSGAMWHGFVRRDGVLSAMLGTRPR